ncbi:MAG: protein kinase [Caldilineaceae bacterium]
MTQTTQTLGKYHLLERLGQGGMAQVYRAHQPVIDRNVAIKVLHPHLAQNGDFVERFKREARGLGQLHHPHIVNVIDFDIAPNATDANGDAADYYLVMDFIAGPTLRQVLDERGALPVAEALWIGEQIADALDYAHKQGAIHRDVKPGNIMFLDKARQHAVLTDFGIARLLDKTTLTITGTLAGTPAYMSPETANGVAADARADIYSLGVVLYEMVTGETPYKGDTPVQLMLQHVTAPLPPLRTKHPALPEMVVQVIERAMAKTPEERFPHAAALRQALLQARLAVNHGYVPQTQMIAPPTVVQSRKASGQPVPVKTSSPVERKLAKSSGAKSLDLASPGMVAQPTSSHAPASPKRTAGRLWLWSLTVIGLLVLAAAGWLAFTHWPTLPSAALALKPIPSAPTAGQVQVIPNKDGQDIVLTIADLAPPATGQQYHAWIIAHAGVLFDLGALTVNAGRVQQVAAAQQNVLAVADRFLVTLERTPHPATPSNHIVRQGTFDTAHTAALGQLLVASEQPQHKPLLSGAQDQVTIAQQHAEMLADALHTGNLAAAKQHAEHVVNILEGEKGRFFGDLNLDGQVQNPGDGVGVRTYLTAAAAMLPTLGLERASLDSALAATDAVVTAARQVAAADTLAEAQSAAAPLPDQFTHILNGPEPSKGGLLAAQKAVAEVPVVSLANGK